MTKAELTAKVAELEATLKANESSQTELTNKLLDAKKQLENINKPKISGEIADQIYLTIEEAQSVLDEYEFTIVDDNSGIVPMDEING